MNEIIKCRRCGRTLKSQRSRKAGIGRVCKRIDRMQAVIDTFPLWQIEKAKEVIDLNAFQQDGELFKILSSDGSKIYMTTDDACTCEAGQHGKMCYHSVAVMLLTA